jgi:phosphatidylethanolamine/phosphatidyl-N-methylethanolamine N-methyltransferase
MVYSKRMALKDFGGKIFAFGYDVFMFPIEKFGLEKLRAKTLSFVEGKRILEVGVGTGLNFQFYPAGVKVFAVEPKFEMLRRAVKRAKNFNGQIYFVSSRVESLPFKDDFFDSVLATFVFCEVENPENGFRELLRVLKPGGRLILLEHVRPGGKFLSKVFDLVNNFTSIFGENINRETLKIALEAGVVIEKIIDVYGDFVKLIIARK